MGTFNLDEALPNMVSSKLRGTQLKEHFSGPVKLFSSGAFSDMSLGACRQATPTTGGWTHMSPTGWLRSICMHAIATALWLLHRQLPYCNIPHH